MQSVVRWLSAAVTVAVAMAVVVLGAPARACGCGAYIPDRPGASIATERALIAFDGVSQDVVMSFNVSGESDTAAWIMPVPSSAQVSLGEPALFEELGRVTAPRVEYHDNWWPTFDWLAPSRGDADTAGARPGSGVNVLGRQRIGPFDVTRLAADDAAGLANWLAQNGFPTSDGLGDNLADYVEDRWEVVAIKLVPGDTARTLTGDLQPLRLSFASDTAVYPMRLSRSARTPQTVDLYVLADHRMDSTAVPVAGHAPTLEFAGPVDSPALQPYLSKGGYLTRWSDFIGTPQSIGGDYEFGRSPEDTAYQRVIDVTRNRGDMTGAILLVLVGLGLVSLTIVAVRRTP
ncbi:DUF2330 domain-containing protein [Mycobacterium sp. B14F4]|uniref:DUF2330 domain-containing protein n=1 Tax=Mycobacterium sp. B14F4 TaxID=3153565 RepID=UPI00325F0018